MIDQASKAILIEHIKKRQAGGREILLSPDLYFEGYEEEHCTICANAASISTARFAARLREIQQRPKVAAAFIRFCDYDDAHEDETCWINSDSVYFITSATLQTVREWLDDFEVSDVWDETDLAHFDSLPEIPDGFRLVAVWWD